MLHLRRHTSTARSRLLSTRGRAAFVLLVALVSLVGASQASAWTTNLAQLDNGTCGTNLQIGSDKTASATATPSFYLMGDGALAPYQMFVDGIGIGSFTANGFANVCVTTSVALSNGPHRLTGYKITNPASTVIPFDFSVDTIAPSMPSIPAMASYSDSGILGDGMTQFHGVAFTGTADPNVSIGLYNGMSGVGGGQSDATGHWSTTTSPLADGTYQVKAGAIDTAGNKSAQSSAFALKIDATAPTGALTNPIAGSTVSGTVPMTASGSDPNGMWKVDFKVDGVSKLVTTTAPYTYNWNSALVANGSHTLSAVIYDAAGNSITSTAGVTVLNGTSTVPGAPTITSATGANSSVVVNWSAPTSNGGSAITGYTVTASPGGNTCTTTGALTCTVGGLTNGISYSFTATATNAVGTGPASSPVSAIPAAAPGAPTGLTAVRGDRQVALTWTAPNSNGGSAITSYTVTALPGGATCTSSVLSCTITNLTNGTLYTFTVTATNAVGTGPASASASATPAGVPLAPTMVSATPSSSTSVDLVWTAAPANGSPVTSYTAWSDTGRTCTTGGTATGCTITGLSPNTSYSFALSATNAIGTGPGSNLVSATTPAALTVPSAPQFVTATRGDRLVMVTWMAPASNGGSPITGYTVTGGGGCTTTGTSCTITGLTNGTPYTFTVTATNAVGTGPGASASATPAARPDPPVLTGATPSTTSVTLFWNAPNNNGSPITGYTASGGGQSCTTNGATSCTVNGLSPNTSYWFTVTATNALGTSNASTPLNATTTVGVTVPSAPQFVTATRGDRLVMVSWLAPASNGGSPITGYTVTGGGGCTTTGTSCTITGLTNGTLYTFTVTATNAIGTGPGASASATPAARPDPPVLTGATPSANSVTLSWNAPNDNGSPITGYTASGGGQSCTTTGATSCTVNGLSANTTYSFTVTATNALGTSNPSTALNSTTTAAAPSAPTITAADPGNSISLTWTAPADTGGAPIVNYNVYRGSSSGTEVWLATVGNVLTYTDETTINDGRTYWYQVSAVNSAGMEGTRSTERSATTQVQLPTDTTPPSKPASMKALLAGTRQIALDWPASTDNVAVTGYEVYRDGSYVGTATETYYLDSGLAPGSSHSYYVMALDAAGNRSAASTAVSSRAASLGTSGTTGTLSGVVFNQAGTPLANAVAKLTLSNGTVKSAKTNNTGIWKLSNLPTGTYTVTVSLTGYATQSSTMTVVARETVLGIATL